MLMALRIMARPHVLVVSAVRFILCMWKVFRRPCLARSTGAMPMHVALEADVLVLYLACHVLAAAATSHVPFMLIVARVLSYWTA